MVTVDQAKKYLHIPYDDDDSFIQSIIDVGYDYLRDAVDDFDKLQAGNEQFARKADALVLTQFLPDLYDKREGGTSGEPALGYVARAMITQLQLYTYTEEVSKSD